MSELKNIPASEFKTYERIYRANLINSLTGYKPAVLIGTYSEKGLANLALFSNIVHLGANPALIGHIQRPLGEFSHTHKNIRKNIYYTINHVHEDFIEKAHYTSAKFEKNTSEFTSCGLTEEQNHGFYAPFVKESKIKIGMKFIEEIPISLNNTLLIIGEVQNLFIDQETILENGDLNLNAVNDVCVSGLNTYHKVTKINRFPYARVKDLPKFWKAK